MDLKELRERQGWSLDKKIDHSLYTIETFLGRLDGKAYVGFSGGKDSTVLLDLCRIIKPDIKAVFCNTGNEYPAPFPLKLVGNIVNCCTLQGGLVYDPFMGSGTTAICAIRNKCDYIGSEISQKYVDMAKERIKIENSQLTLF